MTPVRVKKGSLVTGSGATVLSCGHCDAHGTYVTFLASPLCTQDEWLRKRHALPHGMVPALKWARPGPTAHPPTMSMPMGSLDLLHPWFGRKYRLICGNIFA